MPAEIAESFGDVMVAIGIPILMAVSGLITVFVLQMLLPLV